MKASLKILPLEQENILHEKYGTNKCSYFYQYRNDFKYAIDDDGKIWARGIKFNPYKREHAWFNMDNNDSKEYYDNDFIIN